MFWSGNYIAVRELNFLLKEENVTLTQVLEADDILQECKADNKALIQFLTKPEILAELITLITEEPPKNLELVSQYRHANIACEVLTSHLSMLSDRLSLDATQMNRLCDFLNKDPPLNPLLASYFSKTVEMLLERSPKQDCYLYHIVCLRVLDFFKSRRDFLPNLLRHMATSAIADTFKYFIRLDDLFKKTVMEWLDEHQFLECLIQIICGTYVAEEPAGVPSAPSAASAQPDAHEKQERETSEKPDANHKDTGGSDADGEAEAAARRAASARRAAGVASANAAALLCELVASGCAGDGCSGRARTGGALLARLRAEAGVRLLLGGVFTSPPHARSFALVNGTQLLRALLLNEPALRARAAGEDDAGGGADGSDGADGVESSERSAVELAVAPHLPLLHHALLHHPDDEVTEGGASERGVGLARVQVAALVAQLALSELPDVCTTLLTLGTPGVLVDMFFRYDNNNFLHAQVFALLQNALDNRVYRDQYAVHLLVECDFLTRLMDVFEENANNKVRPRRAYMGHVVRCLALLARALAPASALAALPALRALEVLRERWPACRDTGLRATLQLHDSPLGGYYPSENIYEVDAMANSNYAAANYNFNDMSGTTTMDEMADDVTADDGGEMGGADNCNIESSDFIADGLGIDDEHKMRTAKNSFLELASQRFDDDMWEDGETAGADGADGADGALDERAADAVRDVLHQPSPWDSAGAAGGAGGGAGAAAGGWAQFGAEPARDAFDNHDFAPFWPYADDTHDSELEANMRGLRLEGELGELGDKRMDEASSVELANNLLTAMSAMSADAIANIVNANLPPAEPAAPPPATSSPPARASPPASPPPPASPASADSSADQSQEDASER